MSWFNRKNPEPEETEQAAWMAKARRAILSAVPIQINFKLSIAFHDNTYWIHVAFVTEEKLFEVKPKENPEAFAKKKVVPWILESGLHV